MVELKFIDPMQGKMYFPKLNFYPNGTSLPTESNIIKVSDRELKSMLLKKNGQHPKFEIIKKERKKKDNGGD